PLRTIPSGTCALASILSSPPPRFGAATTRRVTGSAGADGVWAKSAAAIARSIVMLVTPVVVHVGDQRRALGPPVQRHVVQDRRPEQDRADGRALDADPRAIVQVLRTDQRRTAAVSRLDGGIAVVVPRAVGLGGGVAVLDPELDLGFELLDGPAGRGVVVVQHRLGVLVLQLAVPRPREAEHADLRQLGRGGAGRRGARARRRRKDAHARGKVDRLRREGGLALSARRRGGGPVRIVVAAALPEYLGLRIGLRLPRVELVDRAVGAVVPAVRGARLLADLRGS